MSEKKIEVSDVKIVIGYATPEGRKEMVHDISGYNFSQCNLGIERKFAKAKDEAGNNIGLEPTGEYVVVLKVKYHE
jgi:hypothetical protein